MAATSYMGLQLPTVSVTIGPEWASMLNLALTAVDAHDHSTGNGKKITPLGLNINADLSIGGFNLNSVKSTRFSNNSASLSGASDLRSVYVYSNNLYYNNEAGTAIQLTSGNYIYGPSIGAFTANRVITTDSLGLFTASLGTADQVLSSTGSAPSWTKIANTNVDAAAAIAYSKLSLADSIVDADINSAAAIAYSKLALVDSIVDADINSAAAIAYSKLNLADSIVDADINASAAIAYSKLSLTGSIVDADISNSAAIAYSKLSLTSSIVNADISASAAIARNKLAAGTAGHVIINDGSGVLSSEAQLAISRGGTGQTSKTAAFDALSPMSASGDIIYGGTSGTGTRLAKGSDGDVLTLSSGIPSWAPPASAPAVPTVQRLTSGSSATYTTPANVRQIKIRIVGGGGGGAGSTTGASSSGGAGAASTWKTSDGVTTILSAGGGGGGNANDRSSGGTCSSSAVTGLSIIQSITGAGSGGVNSLATSTNSGSNGGSSPFGGAGAGGGGTNAMAGAAAVANSGSGGGGGSTPGGTYFSGSGGGAGGYIEAIIKTPASSYLYTVGSGGSAGTGSGASKVDGGAGGSGIIIIEEYY